MSTLIIFMKYPLEGNVKTRLAESIGEESLEFYKKCIHTLVQEHQNAPYNVVYAVDNEKKEWSEYIDVDQSIEQIGETLSEKLTSVFIDVTEPTIVIGSDLPTITQEDIMEAFEALKKSDCVIGPALDGGYYLIGLKKYYDIFSHIQWSTEKVFEQTMTQLLEQKAKISLLQTREDIDTVDEYNRFIQTYPDF